MMTCGFSFLVFAMTLATTEAYYSTYSRPFSVRKISSLTMRRGRGGLGKDIGGGVNKSTGLGMSASDDFVSRWCKLPPGSMLPTEENKVGLIETNLPTLKNAQVNPNGAVSVLKYKEQTYCFSSSCPSCKIPLTKAKAQDPAEGETAPRLVCDFCKSIYSLGNGDKLGTQKAEGLFGGLMSSIISANSGGDLPLPLYKLGEDKNGNLMIDPSIN